LFKKSFLGAKMSAENSCQTLPLNISPELFLSYFSLFKVALIDITYLDKYHLT